MKSKPLIRTVLGAGSLIAAAIAVALSSSPAIAAEASAKNPASFADVLNATTANASVTMHLTPVRESALREAALVLGGQWGIGDQSRAIIAEYETLSPALDNKYQFNALIMGVGFLPPVISEARNAIAVDQTAMRVANRVWKIVEPARPVINAPTWRDWLYLGLMPDMKPAAPTVAAVLPKDGDAAEQAFWKAEMLRGYAEGKKHALELFRLNLAQLDSTYDGMRRFYDLFKQGKVTAPQIASAQSVIDREDPNTVVVGNTVFRITAGAAFVTDTDNWKPLDK